MEVTLGMMPTFASLAGLPTVEGMPATSVVGMSQKGLSNINASSGTTAILGNLLPYASALLQLPSVGAHVGEDPSFTQTGSQNKIVESSLRQENFCPNSARSKRRKT